MFHPVFFFWVGSQGRGSFLSKAFQERVVTMPPSDRRLPERACTWVQQISRSRRGKRAQRS